MLIYLGIVILILSPTGPGRLMLKVKEYVFWLSSWLEAQTRFAFCNDNTEGCVTLIDTTGAKVTTCPILVLT